MNNGKQQAFPSTRKYIDGNTEVINIQFGLTKREYFAGLAMQGLLANPQIVPILNTKDDSNDLERLSKASIKLSDELLKQLENETTK